VKLPKTYEPNQYEEKIYALWEKSGAFKPKDRGAQGVFSIVMPPPNANADLHIGMGLTIALEDIAIRYQRMQGKKTLYLPGADHAGFETQAVYEKHLAKQGKSRFDLGREELYSQIWDFVAENRNKYESQFRKLGASVDWGRYTFTLDEKIVAQAYATFKKMWDEGLIYRGERLVNYCTHHGTGFADIEVSYKEVKGHLWEVRYPLADGSGDIRVATTRPETMLGDVAVAVHPDDKRYKKLVGKSVKLPLANREIPIIGDRFVDKAFGTGAVKVTPAHDSNDFEIGQRHNLPKITVIGHDGNMTRGAAGKYRGLGVKEARQQVVSDLKDQGFLTKIKSHTHSVGHCYKCGTVIEPLLKQQWFVDIQPLAKPAIEALHNNRITFYPRIKKHQLIRYLEGLRDWNISRQIAWGIPIPAFVNAEDSQDWIFDERAGEKTIEVGGKTYHRDPDVFDTWFSSSSWPYATLGGPGSQDFEQFYPTSLMETGGEILYPWVSRMIMLGLYVAGEIPFREVYIHGYVMAEDGAKMSKSLGNVVNPMPVIEKYGSDALRMGLVSGRAPAVNRGYDHRRLEEARNFCNKLWNIARYAENVLEGKFDLPPKPKTAADHWVLAKLDRAGVSLAKQLENYQFSEASETIYHLIWNDIADWYIEASKAKPNPSVLGCVLQTALKLAHPFVPFVTETIWQTLHPDKTSLLITCRWPDKAGFDSGQAKQFEAVKDIVSEVRQVKTTLDLHGGRLLCKNSEVIGQNSSLIKKLARLDSVAETDGGQGLRLAQTAESCWLDIDPSSAKEFVKTLAEKEAKARHQLKNIRSRLKNPSYIKKAPKKLVAESREQAESIESQLGVIRQQKKKFTGL
jgi:valyl-tRNA synthetase